MKKLFFTLFICCVSNAIIAQEIISLWTPVKESEIKSVGERTIVPSRYKTFHANNNLQAVLFTAPNEKSTSLDNSTLSIELPLPNGTLKKFKIVESPVMAPELAAQFPHIKTFNVKSTDTLPIYGKLDWNDFGFHAMLRMPAGDIFIDPYSRNNTTDYIVYYASDFKKDASWVAPEIGVLDNQKNKKKENFSETVGKSERTLICAGDNLRTYRLAVACTGEYAQAATGSTSPTVSQILSAIVTTINRVDGVYETEVAVKLVLVANETSILYADENSDPFNGNNDGSILIDESQIEIDNTIGDAFYDIGHTFSTGGGGLAYLGCVCYSGLKASAITGGAYPVGDPYDIDYVAHEIGHQFSGQHTFTSNTGSCSGNANPGTEVEPGSGVTIMGYAGICDYNDVASNSIAYFHTISFDQIMEFITYGDGSFCPVITSTNNNIPVVTAGSTYTIPCSTPFILTGSATDYDNDPLTFQWEETDLGYDGDWNSGNAPYFRSYNPTTSLSRMFPKLSVTLSGNYTDSIGEYLPSNAQTLNFRLTARDNKPGGGGICYDNTQVVVSNSGPFTVTSPNSQGIIWTSNTLQNITWDVNGTNTAPVSCSNVNILLSTDGGVTFTILAANAANDGSEMIMAPQVNAIEQDCRIKIECAGNIFFDISNENFTIHSLNTGVKLQAANTIKMKLVPNPSSEQVYISVNGLNKEETTLKVYDIIGNILSVDSFTGIEQLNKKYDLSSLSKGVYIVELSNSQQKVISRLIKQ